MTLTQQTLAQMRAHVDEGGTLTHQNAVELLEHMESTGSGDLTLLVRDVLEKEYFGDWNRDQATELAEKIVAAMERQTRAESGLVEALEFYSQPANYQIRGWWGDPEPSEVNRDQGERARSALSRHRTTGQHDDGQSQQPVDYSGLAQRLQAVPIKAFLRLPTGATFIDVRLPIGELCHEAAAALKRQPKPPAAKPEGAV